MYVMLLLLAPAVCEWVEISQQHYRKPVRHHFQPPLKQTEDYAEETTSTYVNFRRKPQIMLNYPNREMVTESYEHLTTSRYRKPVRTQYYPAEGITEVYVEDAFSDTSNYPYRKPTRTHHVPATERVTEILFEDVTTNTAHHSHTSGIYEVPESTENLRIPNRIYLNQSLTRTNLWNKGNVDKVSKYGNVQRVQLDNNAVKAPNLRINPVRNSINLNNYNRSDVTVVTQMNSDSISNPDGEEPFQVETPFIYTDKRTLSSNFTRKRPMSDPDQISDVKNPSTFNKFKNNTTTEPSLNFGFSTNYPKSVFVRKGEAFTSIKSNKDKNNNFNRNSHFPPRINPQTEIKTNGDKERGKTDGEDITTIDSKEHSNNDSENILNYRPISSKVNIKPKKPADEDEYVTISDDEETNDKGGSNKVNQFPSEEAIRPDVGEKVEQTLMSNDSKANTVENLMTLMKVVADTIRRSTRRSVNSKTKYLTSLKETILSSIKERIDFTWPDDAPEAQDPKTRSARSAQAQATPRGHLEIPSSESALMTISFLTFAVFLIKLVLQVIQTYKNKTMMVTPAVVATVGRAFAASKRSAKP